MSHAMLMQLSGFGILDSLRAPTRRMIWFTSDLLLAASVVGLFPLDPWLVTGIGRIVLFIGIGVMSLLNGDFSPLLPKTVFLETER